MKFLRSSCLLPVVICLASMSLHADDRPPNIVLLIGDDHGYPYFGFMGDEVVHTPTMDAIAAGGYTATQALVPTPYCRPSLRSLITGLHSVDYQHRINEAIAGANAADDPAIRLQKAAAVMRRLSPLPQRLKEAGYVSWQGGKWWENGFDNGHFDEGMQPGWDLSTLGTNAFVRREMAGGEGYRLVRETMTPLYDFIDRHRAQPMFIWFAPGLPHTPYDAPDAYRRHYEHLPISQSAKDYYANISWWDHGVGQLMDYLAERELLDNTLFIYLSDNGWEQDADVEYFTPGATPRNSGRYTAGGSRGKGALHDLSLRTPLIFYWPGTIAPTRDERNLLSSLDLYPTILSIAGLPPPQDREGISLLPLLNGSQDLVDREYLIGYSDIRRSEDLMMRVPTEGYALRTHRWHFIWYRDAGEQILYDVTRDPRGKRDLSNRHPELVRRFRGLIDDWRAARRLTGRLEIRQWWIAPDTPARRSNNIKPMD